MDRSKIISEKRDAARRTRLMARSLSLADDRANLARFAQKLEEEAASLERETSADISNEGAARLRAKRRDARTLVDRP